MGNNIPDQLNEAISVIAKGVLSNGGTYDKTIACTVKSSIEGNAYWVTYGALTFKAIALNDAKYEVGDSVCVVVPQGDYNYEKVIIGKYSNTTQSYAAVDNPISRVIPVIDKKVDVKDSLTTTIDLRENTIKAPIELGNYNALAYEIGLEVDVEDSIGKSYQGQIQLLEKNYTINGNYQWNTENQIDENVPFLLTQQDGSVAVSIDKKEKSINLNYENFKYNETTDAIKSYNYKDVSIEQKSNELLLCNGIGITSDGFQVRKSGDVYSPGEIPTDFEMASSIINLDTRQEEWTRGHMPDISYGYQEPTGMENQIDWWLHIEDWISLTKERQYVELDGYYLTTGNESDGKISGAISIIPKSSAANHEKGSEEFVQYTIDLNENTIQLYKDDDINYTWSVTNNALISHSGLPDEITLDWTNKTFSFTNDRLDFTESLIKNKYDTIPWDEINISLWEITLSQAPVRKELLNLLFTSDNINGDPWHVSPQIKLQGVSNFVISSQLLAADAILTMTSKNLDETDIFKLNDFRIIAGYAASAYDQSKLLLNTTQKVIEYGDYLPSSIGVYFNFIDGTSYGGETVTWRIRAKSIYDKTGMYRVAGTSQEYKELESAKKAAIAGIKIVDSDGNEISPTTEGYQDLYDAEVDKINKEYDGKITEASDYEWTTTTNSTTLNINETFNEFNNDNEVFCSIVKNKKSYSGSIIIYASDLDYSFDIKESNNEGGFKAQPTQTMHVNDATSHTYKAVVGEGNEAPKNVTWYDKTILKYSSKGSSRVFKENESFGKMITAKSSVGHLEFYKHLGLTSIKNNYGIQNSERNTVIALNNIITNGGDAKVETDPSGLTGQREIVTQEWLEGDLAPENRYQIFNNDVFSISIKASSSTDPIYTEWYQVGWNEYYNYYPQAESIIILDPTKVILYESYRFSTNLGFYGVKQFNVKDAHDFVDHLYYIDPSNPSIVYASMYQDVNYDEWYFGDGPGDYALSYSTGGETDHQRIYYLNIPEENSKQFQFSPTIITTPDFTTSIAGMMWKNGRQVNKILVDRHYDHSILSQLFDWTVEKPIEEQDDSESSNSGNQGTTEEKTELEQFNELAVSAGLSHIETGSYIGAGEKTNSITVKGFVPKFILIYDKETSIHWVTGMQNVNYRSIITLDVGLTYVQDNDVTTVLKDKTLTLTAQNTQAALNTKNTKYYWVAFG